MNICFWKKKPQCPRMIVEIRDDYLDVIFDWPKTTNGEEKKHTVVGIANLIYEMQIGNLLPGVLSALAIAGQLQNEKEVADHAAKVTHLLLKEKNESFSMGPLVRPTQLINKGGSE